MIFFFEITTWGSGVTIGGATVWVCVCVGGGVEGGRRKSAPDVFHWEIYEQEGWEKGKM